MSKNTNLSFLTDYITADITNGRIGINNASPAYAFDVTGIARTSTSTYLATASGNVGIGTTSPDRALDIYSASVVAIARVRGNTTNGVALTIQNDQNAQAISIYAAGTSGFGLSGWAGNAVLESDTGTVYSANNGNHIFQTASRTERMRITSTGNVGIGSTTPNRALVVSGGNSEQLVLISSTTSCGISLNPSNTTFSPYIGSTGNDIILQTVGATRLTVTSAGNVGIGTTNAVSTLTVNRSSSGNVATFVAGTSNLVNEYSGITLSANVQGADIWYASEIRSINTNSTPDTLNPRLAFFTQNTGTYLPAGRTEKMSIFGNGNVAIGTSTDNGNKLNVVGNISSNSTVSGSVGSFSTMNANAFKSFVGSTTIAAGATATIYTMDTMGLYTVQASYVGSSIIFCASAIFYAQIYSGNYVKCLDLYDGANIYLFNSGSSIQVRNDGFGTYGFSWTILFQPAF